MTIMIRKQITSVDAFDLCDYIIELHQKNNIPLSLCKLHSIIFFYQIVSKTTHVIPYVDDDFIFKNNFIYLNDVERKYRKEKKSDIAKTKIRLTLASFAYFGSACKLLTELSFYFQNYSDRLLRKLVRKMPIYKKVKDMPHKFIVQTFFTSNNRKKTKDYPIVKMEKKDFIKYYPLKKWEDAYNMILLIDDKMPLFKL